jgi:alkylation response protein AidB-like acyl-CoA dehydrogenase
VDFNLSEEQLDIQKATREFAQGEFDPDEALDLDRNRQFPLKIRKKACHLGFIGMHFPNRYGGQDLGLLENILVVEQFCRHHSGIGMALGLSDFGSEVILRFGNEDQKRRYLPPIAMGEGASSLAYMEKDQTNGFSFFDTVAIRNGNRYLINGKKSFVVNGTLPGPMVVLCQLNQTRSDDQVALLVEKNSDGPVISTMGGQIGMRMVPMVSLTFDDLKVPKVNLIGEEGQGHSQFINSLNEMRIEVAAMGVGIAQGALDLALTYAKQRVQFDQKIASFEAIRNKLANMATHIEMARLLTYKAAWDFDQNAGNGLLNYMAKMVSAETAFEVADDAVQIFGGYGYIVENQIEHFYRDARMLSVFGELGQTQKNLIADRMIGKI